jgi:hypothetical protein
MLAVGTLATVELGEAAAKPAQPARQIIITVCAGRQQAGGSTIASDAGLGLGGERQESELAERRSQVSGLAESVVVHRTMKSGCRTESAPAHRCPIGGPWEVAGDGTNVYVECASGLCHACPCQCSLCFSRRLLQRDEATETAP